MTDNEMRIAIAEECGWKREVLRVDAVTKEPAYAVWMLFDSNGRVVSTNLPDYLNDLNAMAQAEKTLNPNQLYDFFYEKLDEVVQPSGSNFSLSKFHATARQRAEAFLRTVGKWKEPQTVETPIATGV